MISNWIVELTEDDNNIWNSDMEFDSREKAIEEGMKCAKERGLESFRIGRAIPCGIPVIDSDNIIEGAQEQLYYEVGEVAETYLENISEEQAKELEEKLNEVFFKWHKKHGLEPNCYRIEDGKCIVVDPKCKTKIEMR